MKIAISGATGFIGTHLTRYLSGQGHEVTGLGRKWFGRGNADHLAKLMEGMDVVINLAGAPVNHRWTTAYKQELYDSRIIPTRMLVDEPDCPGSAFYFGFGGRILPFPGLLR